MSLILRDLSFGYRGGGRLFDSLAIDSLAPGALTAVVGPNGVGKSTLFRLIAGLLRPAAGKVTLSGVDLASLPHRTRNSRVFFLSQHTVMRAALCVFEVVLLARKSGHGSKARQSDLDRVEQILTALGIDGLSDRPVTDLSGGQQQLVAAAQALVRDPEVLLLDEPTSALDLRRQLEVMELIRHVARDRGIVTLMALHDLGLAGRYADRFILLDRGRVVADGAPHDVLSSAEIEAAYGVGIRVERTSRGGLVVDPFLKRGAGEASAGPEVRAVAAE